MLLNFQALLVQRIAMSLQVLFDEPTREEERPDGWHDDDGDADDVDHHQKDEVVSVVPYSDAGCQGVYPSVSAQARSIVRRQVLNDVDDLRDKK